MKYSPIQGSMQAHQNDMKQRECRVFHVNKKTNKEYLFKTIVTEDFVNPYEIKGTLISRNVIKNKAFICIDCGAEGMRRRKHKRRCDKCQKQVSIQLRNAAMKRQTLRLQKERVIANKREKLRKARIKEAML